MRKCIIILLWTFSLALWGCDTNSEKISEPTFGDPYHIVIQTVSSDNATLDVSPQLDGKMLTITVQYGGGCQPHHFALDERRQFNAAEVWLVHNANNDLCEALITEPLTLEISDLSRIAGTISLLGPDDQSYRLK